MLGRRDLLLRGVVCFGMLALLSCTATGLKVAFCEWEQVTLYCTSGMKLKINDAKYGRDSPYTCCTWLFSTTKCTSKSVTNALKPKCDGKGVCQFRVTNAVLGSDPCANVYKYVVIDYECVSAVPTPPIGIVTTLTPGVPTNLKKAVACEHNPIKLPCPAGQRVNIVKAFYGRTDGTTCPVGQLYSTSCGTDVRAAVAARCTNQQTCVLVADNTLTNNVDPCYGTYKYLTVEYRCVP